MVRNILAIMALAYATAGWSSTATVTLVDKIAVETSVVTLGAVATIVTNDLALEAKLKGLVVSQVPNIGAPKLVTAYQVRALLGDNNLLEGVTISGQQTTVSTAARAVSADELMVLVKAWIKGQITEGADLEVSFLRAPANFEVPKSEGVVLKVEESKGRLMPEMEIAISATLGEKTLTTNRVRVGIALYRDMVVLLKPLARNQLITAEYITTKRCNVMGATGMEVSDPKAVIGLSSKRDLAVGTLMTVNDFEKATLIQRGSLNRIIVINGDIRLCITGAQALQAGKEGELIQFSNPMNPKVTLQGKVIREGVAEMKIN